MNSRIAHLIKCNLYCLCEQCTSELTHRCGSEGVSSGISKTEVSAHKIGP